MRKSSLCGAGTQGSLMEVINGPEFQPNPWNVKITDLPYSQKMKNIHFACTIFNNGLPDEYTLI